MNFENPTVNIEEIPRLADRDFEPLEEDYLYFRISGRSLFYLFAAGIGSLFSLFGKVYFWYWLGPILSLWALSLIFEFVGFKYRGYCLRQMDVSYRSGWLFHTMTTIPLNRVQHCEYSQGPIGRLFDLAQVKVFTAGGTSSDLSIKGLRNEQAIRLRDQITQLSSTYE